MKEILYDLDGKISEHGQFRWPITDDAFAYIRENDIQNFSETNALRTGHINDTDDGFICLENDPYVNNSIDWPISITKYLLKMIAGWASVRYKEPNKTFPTYTDALKLVRRQNNYDWTVEDGRYAGNIETYALLFVFGKSERLPIYTITEDAATMIANARLEETAIEPLLLKATPGHFLFDSIDSILVCSNEQGEFIMANTAAGPLAYSLMSEYDIGLSQQAIQLLEKAKKYVATFLEMKKLHNTPIVETQRKNKSVKSEIIKSVGGITHYSICLSKRYKQMKAEGHTPLNKEGKVLSIVSVSGYSRIQHYGEGNSETRKIWVDSFSRGQWVKGGMVLVSVYS